MTTLTYEKKTLTRIAKEALFSIIVLEALSTNKLFASTEEPEHSIEAKHLEKANQKLQS